MCCINIHNDVEEDIKAILDRGAVPLASTKSILVNLGADQVMFGLRTRAKYSGVAYNTVGRVVHILLPETSMFLMGAN